ncbi:hypothetical protein V1264_022331 [Littorina saxatilis]|uniref:F-box domain-containing protein n=1 Tax=Littorina saxatilis TaxID=31220 RepID=A0AAN9AK93_9CAEN
MKQKKDNINTNNKHKENTRGQKRRRSVSKDPAPGINHGPEDGNAAAHGNTNAVKKQKKTEAPKRKRKRITRQRWTRKKQRISDTKSKTKSQKQNIAETKSKLKSNRQNIANFRSTLWSQKKNISDTKSKARTQKKKVSDTKFRDKSQKENKSNAKSNTKSKTIADIRSKARSQKKNISHSKSKVRSQTRKMPDAKSKARNQQQQKSSCTNSKAVRQEHSNNKFKAENRMQTRLQARNQKRDNYDLRSQTWTHTRRTPDTAPKEQKVNRKPQTLNPFRSLPWCHVIWQHVLPFLSVVDKFRLRAVNTHCKGVVERDFNMALSIGPPHTPPLPRSAWKILTASNRCATSFAVPLIIRGARTYPSCRPFNTRDVYKVLVNLPALRSLDLSCSRIPPTFAFLQAVTELVQGLTHLNLMDVCGMARSRPPLLRTKELCRLRDENLQALAFFKLRHLHTLVLSRNCSDLTLTTVRAIVKRQTSLRRLIMDTCPLIQRKQGDVAEVADIFRTSGLLELALTRTPQPDLFSLYRVCSYRPCPAHMNNVTLFDVIFQKEKLPTGQTTLQMRYPSCFPRGEFEGDPDICVFEEELTAKGVKLECVPCSLEFHISWRLG